MAISKLYILVKTIKLEQVGSSFQGWWYVLSAQKGRFHYKQILSHKI